MGIYGYGCTWLVGWVGECVGGCISVYGYGCRFLFGWVNVWVGRWLGRLEGM